MNDVQIVVGNEIYTTEWVIEYLHDLFGEDYDNCSDEEKKAWVISEYKEIINHDIDKLFKQQETGDE